MRTRDAMGRLLALVLATAAAAGCEPDDGAAAAADGAGGRDAAGPTQTPCERNALLCVGAAAPAWALEQKNTAAVDAGKVFGLEAYRGKPVLVAFLAGW